MVYLIFLRIACSTIPIPSNPNPRFKETDCTLFIGVPKSMPVTGIKTVGLLEVAGGAKVGAVFGCSESPDGSGVVEGSGVAEGSGVGDGSGVGEGSAGISDGSGVGEGSAGVAVGSVGVGSVG
ncbi:MAG TPA: hypothetical protein VK856_06330, partial [Anaerolineaceae bacterium]|nr:hypothetical protein [Anaerolineaceae bacterium]